MKEEQTITEFNNGWKEIQLGKACEKISLNGIKIKQKDYLQEGKYPVVDQGQDLVGGYIDDDKLVVPDEPPYIVFGDHTKVKKYITFKFVAGADGVKVLKPSNDFDPKFFYYSLYTVKIPDKGYARHFQFLEKAIIPLPPKETQQQIVSKIEELFSELDNGIEELKTAQQQLKIYRQAVLKWAFEGKLTNEDVKDGGLPEGWEIKCLGKVSEMCLGKMLDKQKNKGTLKPYLGNINVRWGDFDLNDLKEMKFEGHEQERFRLRKGDLVVCEGGEPGRCAVWKYDENVMIQKALHRVRVSENVNVKYVFYFFNYSALNGSLEKYFTGTTIKHLTGKELKKVELPLPSYREQQQIVQELESRLSVCDKIDETITDSLKQAGALMQSILKKAFEGKLLT